jgi:hypothetical protein
MAMGRKARRTIRFDFALLRHIDRGPNDTLVTDQSAEQALAARPSLT